MPPISSPTSAFNKGSNTGGGNMNAHPTTEEFKGECSSVFAS